MKRSTAVSRLKQELAVADAYTAECGGALVGETADLRAKFGDSGFAEENFVMTDSANWFWRLGNRKPFYETHGEAQVRKGIYRNVIRLRPHLPDFGDELKRRFFRGPSCSRDANLMDSRKIQSYSGQSLASMVSR